MIQSQDSTEAGRPPDAARILLVEDDDALRNLLATTLRREGYAVEECCSGMDLVRCIGEYALDHRPIGYDVAILDIRMPGVSGLEAVQSMRDLEGWPPTILITAFGDQALHKEAMELGVWAVFDKPFDIQRFLDAVRRLATRTDDPV